MPGFDFLSEALRASGASPEAAALCRSRLEVLLSRAAVPPGDARHRAKALFNYLGQSKPRRYQPGGEFCLHRAVANQLRPEPGPVGNCLGLTLLYNALALGLGLKVGALYLPEAFGRGPHTCSLLYVKRGIVIIEHIFPDGFGYAGHRENRFQEKWGERELVAEVWVARGNALWEQGDLSGAAASYREALEVCPGFPKAVVNLEMVKGQSTSPP